MNKPVYEIPIGDGEKWPTASGRRVADSLFNGTTPTPPTPAPDLSFLNAPPPPATATPFPAPAPGTPYQDATPAPSFERTTPPAYAPPPSYEQQPAASQAYAPPVYEQPTTPPPAYEQPAFAAPVFSAPAPAAPIAPPAFEVPVLAPVFEMPQAAPAHKFEPEPPKRSHAPEAPPVIDRSPQVGEGQAGSHPDIITALNAVITNGASDLHVTAGAAPMIRIDGGLRPIPGMAIWEADHASEVLRSILSERQREIFESDLELDFAYQLSPSARFRVNIYQQRDHMGAAMRLIPTEIKKLDDLGIPTKIGDLAQLARGLVLVTGPTGSGKSTTLAALIDVVNETRADHIVTVEDPIEFMHENKKSLVNQREVGHDTHSFANALKHVLRQDPDVILIGELRDLETISVALTAAETGHLVFATLHTQDAGQTVDRVIDVFPPHQQGQVRAQLAATLQGVVCQTLVKKANGKGRAVATEVLIATPAIANLIREGKTYQIRSAMQAGREHGMHTMDQHLADLVNAGQITHQAAYDKAHDVEDLKQLISRAGGDASPTRGDRNGINFGDSFSKGA
jgi:twitching motility protein PilT